MSDDNASQLTNASTEAKSSIWNFKSKSKMKQIEVEEWQVKVQPQNVIVFYRNQIQSASTIKINVKKVIKIVETAVDDQALSKDRTNQTVIANRASKTSPKTTIKNKHLSTISSEEENSDATKLGIDTEAATFVLKTTNSKNYRVSQKYGSILAEEKVRYINIMIMSQASLQNCLRDKFRLLITLPGKLPIKYTYKVVIDYKKDFIHKDKDFGRLQLASRSASSTHLNSTESVIGNPLSVVKKSLMKKSQLVNYLGDGHESERVHMKQNLDMLIKQVDKNRIRLEYLERDINKTKSRRRFMLYVTLATILLFFISGIITKKAVIIGWNYAQTL